MFGNCGFCRQLLARLIATARSRPSDRQMRCWSSARLSTRSVSGRIRPVSSARRRKRSVAHLAVLRMLPARQRLDPDQPPGLERQFGQELDGQQVVLDRRPQVVAQLVLGIVLPVRRLVIRRPRSAASGAPAAWPPRHVGSGHACRARAGDRPRRRRSPRDPPRGPAPRTAAAASSAMRRAEAGGLLRTGKPGHQQAELGVAEPGERVRSAQALLDPPDQEADQLVGERLARAYRRSA